VEAVRKREALWRILLKVVGRKTEETDWFTPWKTYIYTPCYVPSVIYATYTVDLSRMETRYRVW
jgi:hypothetical protein